MDLDLLTTLNRLNVSALACLRTGTAPEPEWFDKGVAVVTSLKRPKEYSYDDEVLVSTLKARQRFADLADRMGRQDDAIKLIGDDLPWVQGQLEGEGHVVERTDRYIELIWYSVVHSLVAHRSGRVSDAVDTLKSVQKFVDRLKGDHFDLRHRIALAIGRHLQSLANRRTMGEIELHYTEALRYCELIANNRTNPDPKYARYRLGVTITALARLFLERGELARALRECYTAKTILKSAEPSPDELTTAYIDYLMGSIFRQQGEDLPRAISLLKEAHQTFVAHQHPNHYLRSRHEIAKAYLNRRDWGPAMDILNLRELPNHLLKRSVWDANDACLKGRILLAKAREEKPEGHLTREQTNEIQTFLEEAFATLRPHIKEERYRDLITKALVLHGELSLALNKPEDVMMGKTMIGESLRLLEYLTVSDKMPLDRTDLAWGWLVIAETALQLNNVERSVAALSSYQNQVLENKLFEDRATRISALIDEKKTSHKKGLWFPAIEPKAKDSKEKLAELGLSDYPTRFLPFHC